MPDDDTDRTAPPAAPTGKSKPDPVVRREAATPEVTRWRYTGPPSRVYSMIPVTVDPGDVIDHPRAPADDGCWQPTLDKATKRPDNWRDDPVPGFGLALRESEPLTEEELSNG